MAKYLIQASYVGEGVKGLLKDGGTRRRAAAEAAAKSLGGSLESFYFAFGDTDAYVVVDLPDNVAMSALALTVGATGAVRCKTTAGAIESMTISRGLLEAGPSPPFVQSVVAAR